MNAETSFFLVRAEVQTCPYRGGSTQTTQEIRLVIAIDEAEAEAKFRAHFDQEAEAASSHCFIFERMATAFPTCNL